MDVLGKATAFLFLAGSVLLGIAGCSNSSGEHFERYDALKKSPPDSGQKPSRVSEGSGPQALPKPSPALASSQQPGQSKAPAAIQTAPAVDQERSNAAAASPSRAVPAAATSPGKQKSPVTVAVASVKPLNTVPAAAKSVDRPQVGASKRPVQLLVPERKFRHEGAEQALRVSYDDLDLLKVLNMDPVTPDAPALMPAWLKSLDGQRVRIRGFMYPTFQQTGIRAFGLARDNQICCFGRNPKIYDVFDVALRGGATTDYIPNRPFDVVGVFHIRPELDEGKMYRLYEMDDAIVITR